MALKQRNVNYTVKFQQVLAEMAAGRTLDEQVQDCRNTGNHAPPVLLRRGLLRALGVPNAKQDADIFLTFGCYIPFWSPMKLRDHMKLLGLLGIEFNWSDSEICCGVPIIEDAVEVVDVGEEERQRILGAGQEFMQFNCDLAKEGGQKIMVYACHNCVCAAKKAFPNEADQHQWIYDPVMDKLEKMTLEMPSPTVMGWFEGCHRFFPHNGNLDWKRYRRVLGTIKGLELVDLPRMLCCKQDPEGILEDAAKRNVSTILAPDGDCNYMLKMATPGTNMKLLNLSEMLLQVLGA